MSNDSRGHPTTLRAIAEAVRGRVQGDGSIRVAGVRSPIEAGPNDLAFVSEARYLAELEGSAAAAVLVDETLDEHLDRSWASVLVNDAQDALVTVLERLHPTVRSAPGIHPTAVIGRGAEIAEDVTVGPYVVIGDHARIGAGSVLSAHGVVSRGCRIGRGCMLHPHVVLYEDVELGDRVVLHSGARIGIDGFGYVPSGDGVRKLPHHGPCVIGDDVEIGANACIDRASLDRTEVGRSTKLDNLVHIGHNVRIGEGTMMAALVGIAGSVRIGAGTQWGGQSGAVDHQVIGDGAKIAGKTGVSSEVEPGQTVMGFPSRPHREHMKALAGLYRLDELQDRVRTLEQRLDGVEGAAERVEGKG